MSKQCTEDGALGFTYIQLIIVNKRNVNSVYVKCTKCCGLKHMGMFWN